jgi:hypothetical protein
MSICQSCGSDTGDDARLCPDCLDTADQSTTSFVPVGRPKGGDKVEHSPEDDIFLQIVKGPQVGERFYLEGDYIVIGRDPQAQLFLGDVTVSREHAAIIREGSKVAIKDLASLNGTYLNGDIVEEAFLESGNIIQIGTFQLMFCWGA